jgi:hypothetical protein
LKKISDLIGNRTRDLLANMIVPQATPQPRPPNNDTKNINCLFEIFNACMYIYIYIYIYIERERERERESK